MDHLKYVRQQKERVDLISLLLDTLLSTERNDMSLEETLRFLEENMDELLVRHIEFERMHDARKDSIHPSSR